MVRTVPRVHPARLPFGRGHIGVRHLPLHTDDELQHQQRCNHPVCGSVTHDLQRTLLAAMGEEARVCRKAKRAASVRCNRMLRSRLNEASSAKATSRVKAAHVRLVVVASAGTDHHRCQAEDEIEPNQQSDLTDVLARRRPVGRRHRAAKAPPRYEIEIRVDRHHDDA